MLKQEIKREPTAEELRIAKEQEEAKKRLAEAQEKKGCGCGGKG